MVKEKDKNTNSSLSDYQRYIRGEMTKREENSFLRKFQDDPFAEKTTVSFSGISPRGAADDKDSPVKLLKKWVISRKRIVLFSAAALGVVVMIISSIIIISDKNRTSKQLTIDNLKPVLPEVTDSNHITGLIPAVSKNNPDSAGLKINSETTKNNIDTVISAGTNNTSITGSTDTLAITAGKDSTLSKEKDQISAPAMESATQEITALNVRGKNVSTEFGVSKKTENKQPGYRNPLPSEGVSNFNRYIEEKMIKPLANSPGEDSVIVISFMVLASGTIDSIKVINSPGDEFDREAVRLIRGGPAWKPAEINGRTIDDEVRVRIVSR
jgi:TonB family protein